jgi:general secretion pathway protein H
MRSSVSYHPDKFPDKSHYRGFTLIELLVVLVILAIAAAAAAPNASRWIESYTIRKASKQLVSDLQLTKLKAISQGVKHRIEFDPANKTYQIKRFNGATWDPVDIVRSLSDANNPYGANGVAFTDTFTNNTVTFSPTGTASPMGSVTLSTANYNRVVTVILTGRISVG